MLLGLVKLIAPMVLSSVIGIDDWTSPLKQENPYTSIVGLTMKNLGEYLMDESSGDNIQAPTTNPTNDDNITIEDIYNSYENKSYRMNF